MKYATWVLDFTDPMYGTGPEYAIVEQNGMAEGAFTQGDITKGGKILGYFSGDDLHNLETWQFTEITRQEALDFVLALDATAYIGEDDKIHVERPQEESDI